MGDKGFYNGVQKWGETLLKRYGKTTERKNQVRKVSPGALLPHTAISVKMPSESFEIATNVFLGVKKQVMIRK